MEETFSRAGARRHQARCRLDHGSGIAGWVTGSLIKCLWFGGTWSSEPSQQRRVEEITFNTGPSACGSFPANCQAMPAAEATSMTESSPNPINAVEDAAAPAVRAT